MIELDKNKVNKIKNKLKNFFMHYIKILNDSVVIDIDLIIYKDRVLYGTNNEFIKRFLFANDVFNRLDEVNFDKINIEFRRFVNDESSNNIKYTNICYINLLELKDINEKVLCYLTLEGFEENTIEVYNNFNQYSFVKFVLDNIFKESIEVEFYTCKILNHIIYNDSDYLRNLARTFTEKIKNIISENKRDSISHDINNLFDELNYISSMNYEGESVSAKLLLMNKKYYSDNIFFYIEMENEIKFDSPRKIRKLLQMADKNTYLIGDHENIYGLGRLKNLNNLKEKPVFIIDFLGRFEYGIKSVFVKNKLTKFDIRKNKEEIEWYLKEKNIINIIYGKPKLIEGMFSSDKLKDRLKKIFKDDFINDNKCIEELINIIDYVKDQKHGTTVVITTSTIAQKEVKKLQNQSIIIKKKNLLCNRSDT